jgi:hypothetical protein
MIDIIEDLIPSQNYIKQVRDKKQIVLGDVYPNAIKSLWRDGGKYKQFPHYTINRNGEIFKHFDDSFFTYYLDSNIDENVITIGLENVGSIYKLNGNFYDIYNNKYEDKFFQHKWKNISYWQEYSKDQFEKSIELCRFLLDTHKIERKITENNSAILDIDSYQGICYRANHDNKHNDLNPSWNFNSFKQLIENE